MTGAATLLFALQAQAHNVYLANENHTDYGWNASTEVYDASMLAELDFYLGRIAATAGQPFQEQARFAADCWYYLWLYEHRRSPKEFVALVDAIESGHISVPLNPLVTLYGALPTEAAIRAGYYPGRIERQFGVPFVTAEAMENHTVPWGLSSLWASSKVKYSWKGICACASTGPYQDHKTDVFRWQGPDGQELLMKWYEFSGNNQSWGGYAEARSNLSLDSIQAAIDHFSTRGQSLTGLFGYGWDDVTSQTDAIVEAVRAWNAAHPDRDQAIVSNTHDYFEELQGTADALPVLRGGWGNDWDLLPATLAQPTALLRRAVEQLRTAEALAAVVHTIGSINWWPWRQAVLEDAWISYHKYFEHTWTDGGVGIDSVIANKKQWQKHFIDTVTQVEREAATAFAALFAIPDENRFAVFNQLAFVRTDYADLPVSDEGPFIVTDLATGSEVPSQVIAVDGERFLRVLASDVPSLGYRVYRYTSGTPTASDCCTVSANDSLIENSRYIVSLGERGQINSAVDKRTGREIAGSGLNDFDSGSVAEIAAEDVGSVSATLRVEIQGTPPRRTRVTIFRDIDRISMEDEILANHSATSHYRFNVNLANPEIHFEEVGAVARPGLADQGGDFLPGTRANYMTMNHFVDLADPSGAYHVTLSSRDAFAVRIGNSTPERFDLPSSELNVLALGNVAQGHINDQGGETLIRHSFALQGWEGGFAGSDAMRMGLAQQNPLRAVRLPRNQKGSLTSPVASLLSVDASNVVVTAVKPAEDKGGGLVIRLWELDGRPSTTFTVNASAYSPSTATETSLVETDLELVPITAGQITTGISAHEIKSLRLARPKDNLVALIAAIFALQPARAADLNGDSKVGAADLPALTSSIGNG